MRNARDWLRSAADNEDLADPEGADLRGFLEGLDKATLVALLCELAGADPAVHDRLERHKLSSDPARLAGEFERQLARWRRSTRFISYGESREFAAELEKWLDQVERELLPIDPRRALSLFERLIESDGKLIERADDSDGNVGDALRSACGRWLLAASRSKTIDRNWLQRIYELANADEYGVREELLRQANLVLDDAALRELAARFESDLDETLKQGAPAGQLPVKVFGLSGSLSLLGEALRDPDVSTRAVLRYSPRPNALQKAGFAEQYLKFGRPSEALRWLEDEWDSHESRRLPLLAEAYRALGRSADESRVRRRIFDFSGIPEHFRAWRETLASDDWPLADDAARQRARAHADPLAAAQLWLEIGDARAAEETIVHRFQELDGRDYPRLLALAQTLEAKQLLLGCTACYRALLNGVLSRGNAAAYSHAAKYFAKLGSLAQRHPACAPLESPDAFETRIRSDHRRKVSFWKHVAEQRSTSRETG